MEKLNLTLAAMFLSITLVLLLSTVSASPVTRSDFCSTYPSGWKVCVDRTIVETTRVDSSGQTHYNWKIKDVFKLYNPNGVLTDRAVQTRTSNFLYDGDQIHTWFISTGAVVINTNTGKISFNTRNVKYQDGVEQFCHGTGCP